MRWLSRLRSWWLGWREDVAYAEQQDFHNALTARRAEAWGDIPNTLPLTSVPNVDDPGCLEHLWQGPCPYCARRRDDLGIFGSGKVGVHPMRGMNDD